MAHASAIGHTPIAHEQITPRTLNAADRCDQCGAKAWVRATLTSGSSLHYCAHHARTHESELRPLCSEWLDETNTLTAEVRRG